MLELENGDVYTNREHYEHRDCLSITKTATGEFVKCNVCTGSTPDAYEVLGPAKPIYDQVRTLDTKCPLCGDFEPTIGDCQCTNTESSVRRFETGEAQLHPDDVEKGILS